MDQVVANNSGLPGPLRGLLILTRRELRARLSSVWLYVVASTTCLLAAVYGGGFLNAFKTETVLVSADPLVTLNTIVLVFLALVLGLRLATSLSWEREHRTLEVLLVGPIRLHTVVLSKFVAECTVLLLLISIYWIYLLFGQPMGAGTIGIADTFGLWRSVVFTLPVLALGLLVSGFFSSVRASVVCYLIVVAGLALVEITTLWLRVLPPDQLSLSVLYLRSGLENAHVVLQVVSALSYLSDLIATPVGLAVLTPLRALMAVLITGASLLLTIGISKRKGAQ